MNFNSVSFLLFFPAVVTVFALVRRNRLLRDIFLLVASYSFYMSWNWKYAGLIATSTLVDYCVGRRLDVTRAPATRRILLVASLVANIGLLAIFKYYNFFVDVTEEAAAVFGCDISLLHHDLLLPVGISFYTFQTLSYTIDLYRRRIPVEKNLLRFAVFVSFFPQLVAGPIVRAKAFLPQLKAGPNLSGARFDEGISLIFRGLCKKILIADLLAELGVDAVFADPASFSSWDLLFALYGYSFQIYNDFSGYSDIAIGSAKVMGFDIPQNFNRPYLSQNVREFWTRWHISLSTWLRDYLYIPLGGSQRGATRTRMNLVLTMLLGGLWHGASMNFILWGAYHGLLLILPGRRADRAPAWRGAASLARQIACFHLVTFGWLLFRINNMDDFSSYLHGLAAVDGGTRLHAAFYAVLGLAVATHGLPRHRFANLQRLVQSQPLALQAALYASLLIGFCGATLGAPKFIYFQF